MGSNAKHAFLAVDQFAVAEQDGALRADAEIEKILCLLEIAVHAADSFADTSKIVRSNL